MDNFNFDERLKSFAAFMPPSSIPFDPVEQIAKARKAEEWNKQPPQRRPDKSRLFEMLRIQSILLHQNDTETMYKMKGTTITGQAHSSKHTTLTGLKPIKLRQMQVPFIHTGRFLACRTITDAYVVVGTSVLVEDPNGDVERLKLYNFNADLNNSKWLKRGTIMLIKEPYLEFALGAHSSHIHVESPSDVIFVDETDKELLEQANALCWHRPKLLNFEELKANGNQAFGQGQYDDAIQYYQRALKKSSNSSAAVIHSNLAITLINLNRFYEAYQHAEKAVNDEKFREKCLIRLGMAAYGMRDWQMAGEHFGKVLKEFPATKEATEGLENAKARQMEAETGKFDMGKLFEEVKRGKMEMDLADYCGPVKVQNIPGKGKGVVATKSIKKGELLLAEKAYSYAMAEDAESLPKFVTCINLMSNEARARMGLDIYFIIETIQKLKSNPQTAKQLYALYAGPDMDRDEQIEEAIIHTARIQRICNYNAFGAHQVNKIAINNVTELGEILVDKEPGGIWLLSSFLNHSCLANTSRIFYGDMLFFFAINDINEGEELTTYYCALNRYKKREQDLAEWGFTCDCQLCQIDRADPQRMTREKLLDEYEKIWEKAHQENPHKWHKKVLELVKELRKTYKDRPQYRYELIAPLMMLRFLYVGIGQPMEAIRACQEAIEAGCEQIYHLETRLWMAEIYAFKLPKPDKQMAKNLVQEAFEMAKVNFGITKEAHFKEIYAEFPICHLSRRKHRPLTLKRLKGKIKKRGGQK